MLLLTVLVVKNSYFLAENYFTFPEKRRRPKLKGTNTKFGYSWKDGKTPKKYNKSDLIHDSNHIFYNYHDIRKFESFCLESKYSFLAKWFR